MNFMINIIVKFSMNFDKHAWITKTLMLLFSELIIFIFLLVDTFSDE